MQLVWCHTACYFQWENTGRFAKTPHKTFKNHIFHIWPAILCNAQTFSSLSYTSVSHPRSCVTEGRLADRYWVLLYYWAGQERSIEEYPGKTFSHLCEQQWLHWASEAFQWTWSPIFSTSVIMMSDYVSAGSQHFVTHSACWVVCICYGFSSSVEAGVLYNFPSFCAAQSVESVRAKTSILAAALSLKQHHLSMYTESDDKLLFLHKHAVSKFFFSAWPALLEDDCYTTSSLQILLLVH